MIKPYHETKYGVLYQGDCLEVIPFIAEQGIKVDLVLTDPPYGTTKCKWDSIIPLNTMWVCLNNITKSNSAIVLTATQPFSSRIICSCEDMFKYSLVWKKTKIQHFAQAPYRFLTEHEDILVFSNGGTAKNAKIRMRYFPQGVTDCHKVCKGKGHSAHRPSKTIQANYVQTKTGYPKSILEFPSSMSKFHPTEKPIALMEYLIKTYTEEGNTVLDFTIGSGTTAIAAINTNRKYIGIEMDHKYCEIAKKRIEQAYYDKSLLDLK